MGAEDKDEAFDESPIGSDVVPGVGSASLAGFEDFFSCFGEGVGGEDDAGSSDGISSDDMSSPGSARTAIRVPTLTPFEPSCACHHAISDVVFLFRSASAVSYHNLCKDAIVLSLDVHCSLVRLNLQYHISSRERIT